MGKIQETNLRGQPFNFWGGGGWVILEKDILQVHVRKEKFLAQDYCPKKNSRTHSGLEKNSGKMFPGLTHRTLSADC